jgi:hypothetical protein
MYNNDGFAIFNSKQTTDQINTWLNIFQLAVDEVCGNSVLQFTAVMWQSSGRSTLDMEKLFINTGPVFNSCYI